MIAAGVATAILAALSGLQVLVAAGRPYGRLVWGGQHRVLPRRLRVGSAASVPLYATIASLLLWRSGAWGAPPDFAVIATWVVFGYFMLGIALNAISRSRPERLVMTPTCVALAVCSLLVALS